MGVADLGEGWRVALETYRMVLGSFPRCTLFRVRGTVGAPRLRVPGGRQSRGQVRVAAVVWVATYGKGQVCEYVLGHDVAAMKSSPSFQVLLVRGVEWAATGEAHSPVPAELKKGN